MFKLIATVFYTVVMLNLIFLTEETSLRQTPTSKVTNVVSSKLRSEVNVMAHSVLNEIARLMKHPRVDQNLKRRLDNLRRGVLKLNYSLNQYKG